jgi:hypothetical protein
VASTASRTRRGLLSAGLVCALGFVGCSARPGQPAPSAQAPDPALRGTVAYLDPLRPCVRVAAVAVTADRVVRCFPRRVPAPTLGPQLRWLPGGRLEITVFRLPATARGQGPAQPQPGWQEVVDVRAGTSVRSSDPPAQPDRTGCPATSPTGAVLTTTTGAGGGAELVLTGADGRDRTLLRERVPSGNALLACWSPDGSWIAVDDGRLLVLRPGSPPGPRLLAQRGGSARHGLPPWAVTEQDLLGG